MGWKEDLNYGLAAFGVQIPTTVPVDQWPRPDGEPGAEHRRFGRGDAAALLRGGTRPQSQGERHLGRLRLLLDMPERRLRRHFRQDADRQNPRQHFDDHRAGAVGRRLGRREHKRDGCTAGRVAVHAQGYSGEIVTWIAAARR